MKNLFTLLLAFLALSITVSAQNELPDINLSTVEGEKINFKDYGDDGKITVFCFWATWCAPCKKELSNIAEIYEDWQEDYDVEVVAVSIDDQRNVHKIKPYVDGQGWDYTVLLDPNQDLMRALNFQNVPYTMMVDKTGKVVYKHNRYVEGDEYELEDHIAEIADGK